MTDAEVITELQAGVKLLKQQRYKLLEENENLHALLQRAYDYIPKGIGLQKEVEQAMKGGECLGCRIDKLQGETERLREAYENIRTYLMEKINEKNGYIKTMKSMSKNDEYYDQAQTNIMETEEQLIEYNWINNKIEQALKGK